MPKEQIRKRGRRKPKTEAGAEAGTADSAPVDEPQLELAPSAPTDAAGPSGIHPSRAALLKGGPRPRYEAPVPTADQPQTQDEQDDGVAQWERGPRVDSEFPFGVLDPDVKAYFRNVEDQIKDWEGVNSVGEEREDRKLFLASVLAELRGHELQVATDPDTAVVLERLLPSMGDWGRRVVGDAFGDSWEEMIRHRFGSHVAQTWFTLGAETLDRESKGIYPPQQLAQAKQAGADVGELPTMTNLFVSLVTSLLPSFPSLLTSPHASPPLRLLLLVLTPNRALPSLDGSDGGIIRSKRSNKYRKGHGVQGKSFVGEEEDAGKGKAKAKAKAAEEVKERSVPKDLVETRRKIRGELMEKIDGAEWRSMALNMVGSAAVQLLLELEVEDGEAERELSLLDQLTEGLVASLLAESEPTPQPFLTSLHSSTTGTRVFEAILQYSPPRCFDAIWKLYFVGKIGKLAGHPFANFVVAKGVSRLEKEGVENVVRECRAVSGGKVLIKSARTSVLQALVERATAIGECQMAVLDLIRSAIALPDDQPDSLVPCLLVLKTYPMYQALLTGEPVGADEDEIPEEARDATAEEEAAAAARYSAWQNRRTAKPTDALAPNMQGCLLLQSMVGLTGGANAIVLESLLSQNVDTLLTYASSPIASHLLDAALTNPSTPPKYRRRLMLSFQGRYRQLAEDRLGSRVAETIWDTADGFMKEKMARSLLPEATALGNSQYGKYLARRMRLFELKTRPDEWKEAVLGLRHHFAHQKDSAKPKPGLGAQSHVQRTFPQALVSEKVDAEDPSARAPADAGTSDERGEEKKGKEKKKRKKSVVVDEDKDEIDDLFKTVEQKKSKKSRR